MAKMRVLFLCTGNSCRSQMAEGFAREYAGEDVEIFSAGTEPQGINPIAVEVMREAGIDISKQQSEGLDEKNLEQMDYIITLCGDARESCPLIPVKVKKMHWPLPDPARAEGTDEEIAKTFRRVRDDIEKRVKVFLAEEGALG